MWDVMESVALWVIELRTDADDEQAVGCHSAVSCFWLILYKGIQLQLGKHSHINTWSPGMTAGELGDVLDGIDNRSDRLYLYPHAHSSSHTHIVPRTNPYDLTHFTGCECFSTSPSSFGSESFCSTLSLGKSGAGSLARE